MGRKAIPIETHRLKGSFQPSRHGKRAGADSHPGMPACPKTASDAVKAAWKDFAEILFQRRVLTTADATALEILATTTVEYRDLLQVISVHGRTYEITTKSGGVMHRAHPAVAMLADCQRRLNSSLANFGLDPSSRGKVPVLADGPQQNRFAALGDK